MENISVNKHLDINLFIIYKLKEIIHILVPL